MSDSDVTIISEWLHSGGHYTLYTDPTQFLKLLLDKETGRVLSSTLREELHQITYTSLSNKSWTHWKLW